MSDDVLCLLVVSIPFENFLSVDLNFLFLSKCVLRWYWCDSLNVYKLHMHIYEYIRSPHSHTFKWYNEIKLKCCERTQIETVNVQHKNIKLIAPTQRLNSNNVSRCHLYRWLTIHLLSISFSIWFTQCDTAQKYYAQCTLLDFFNLSLGILNFELVFQIDLVISISIQNNQV